MTDKLGMLHLIAHSSHQGTMATTINADANTHILLKIKIAAPKEGLKVARMRFFDIFLAVQEERRLTMAEMPEMCILWTFPISTLSLLVKLIDDCGI